MKEPAKEYFLKKLKSQSDYNERLVFSYFNKDSIKKIHLTGICGKAMASLAGLLIKSGYYVTGSEEHWNPPMSTVLENLGIQFKPFSEDNLRDIDLLIMGNAYSPLNIEAKWARENKIPQLSSAEAYAMFFIENRKSIVIAGTHGKTTTSGLAGHVFIDSEKKANVLVGGVMSNIGESYYYGGPKAQYSVVEGDEYDTAYFDKSPKFLHYKPVIGVITSIEFDHADIYSDMDDYLSAFLFFAQEIPKEGYLLVNEKIKKDYIDKLKSVCLAPVFIYGFSDSSDIKIHDNYVDLDKGGQVFSISLKGKEYKGFFVPLFGLYNLENSATVVAISLIELLDENQLKLSLASFKGTEQRQQVLYEKNDIVVISDFAHHPTAVSVTISGVRDHYPSKRLITVFEPRSATSRRKDFEVAYSESFDKADLSIISQPPIKSVDDVTKMMDINFVTQLCKKRGVELIAISSTDEIYKKLIEIIKPGDVILTMSNGTFDGLSDKISSYLKKTV